MVQGGHDGARSGEPAHRIAELAGRASRIMQSLLAKAPTDRLQIPDPDSVADAFRALGRAFADHPELLLRLQARLWAEHARMWHAGFARMLGMAAPAGAPEPQDRRFQDPAWSSGDAYDWLKQTYLINGRWLMDVVEAAPDLDAATRTRVRFHARQLLDALAPSNFALTNPVVMARAAETGGASLVDGLGHLLDDLERSGGEFQPAMTGGEPLRLGDDVAATPGSVVWRNELMELIQYAPTTEKVAATPLLIVPPWINKFYILDLRPQNSLVRWAVGQGLTVFMISWVNPDRQLAGQGFEDYLRLGPLAALDAIERQTGARTVNLLGYCLGGTLSACLMAYLAARKERRVRAATLLTCLTDFADPGELGVFIDERQIGRLESHMRERGYLEARYMQRVFAALRANDLIWSFAVNSYLLGKEPGSFDLLYWSSDGTRMPSAMHAFYLRRMYLENRLVEPGGITLLGTPLDLGRIRTPVFFLSTRDDHIAPWTSTYAGSRRFGGPTRFVLGGSGHIAGVINPPDRVKYGYWTDGPATDDPQAWLAGADEHPGSWWPHWRSWLRSFDGRQVRARDDRGGPLAPLEPAPGRNVLARALD